MFQKVRKKQDLSVWWLKVNRLEKCRTASKRTKWLYAVCSLSRRRCVCEVQAGCNKIRIHLPQNKITVLVERSGNVSYPSVTRDEIPLATAVAGHHTAGREALFRPSGCDSRRKYQTKKDRISTRHQDICDSCSWSQGGKKSVIDFFMSFYFWFHRQR